MFATAPRASSRSGSPSSACPGLGCHRAPARSTADAAATSSRSTAAGARARDGRGGAAAHAVMGLTVTPCGGATRLGAGTPRARRRPGQGRRLLARPARARVGRRHRAHAGDGADDVRVVGAPRRAARRRRRRTTATPRSRARHGGDRSVLARARRVAEPGLAGAHRARPRPRPVATRRRVRERLDGHAVHRRRSTSCSSGRRNGRCGPRSGSRCSARLAVPSRSSRSRVAPAGTARERDHTVAGDGQVDLAWSPWGTAPLPRGGCDGGSRPVIAALVARSSSHRGSACSIGGVDRARRLAADVAPRRAVSARLPCSACAACISQSSSTATGTRRCSSGRRCSRMRARCAWIAVRAVGRGRGCRARRGFCAPPPRSRHRRGVNAATRTCVRGRGRRARRAPCRAATCCRARPDGRQQDRGRGLHPR